MTCRPVHVFRTGKFALSINVTCNRYGVLSSMDV